MRKARFYLSIFALIFCFSSLFAQLLPLANSDTIQSHINYLGSDDLQGRATGSPGLVNAATYISTKLKEYGLLPKGHNNSWFQPVPMHGTKILPSSTLQIYFENVNQYLFYKKDFLVIKSGGEAYNPGVLPVYFVGYGITAPEYNYDDYQGIDVSGKIVLFFDGEPSSADPKYFEGNVNTIYALPEAKIRTAISHGAVGSIIIYNPEEEQKNNWAKKRSEYIFEEVTLPGRVTAHMALYLNPQKADLFFQGSGATYSNLLHEKSANTLKSFPLKTQAAFNGDFKQREFKSDNILAELEGRDASLSDDYLFIGAHYDHLGVGEAMKGDSIYNGVMDNAVGTAVVLELARMYSLAGFRPRRSIIFGFFTGEEKGLLGSEYYVTHPQVSPAKTIAMINIDGLSAFGAFSSVIGVGGRYSTLGKSLENVAAEFGLQSEILKQTDFEQPFSKSDQLSFALAGIPSIQVVEGYSYAGLSRDEILKRTQQWFANFYHSPFDDLKQSMDYNSIIRYASFMFFFTNRLLNQDERPRWLPDSPYQSKRAGQ